MATEFFTASGEHAATRFFGGKANGMSFQMEVTAAEWDAWKNEMVAPFGSDDFRPFADWVEGARVVWDNAARQNQMARDMEGHRFAVEVPAMAEAAAAARMRARRCARDSMRMV